MNKILILSYFYPPANFVGAQRTAAWANYLHEFGYYPIIITRKWNEGQTDLIDEQENNELEVEFNETHEVHRLPYKRSLRDRLSYFPTLKPLQKAFTLKEIIFSNFFLASLPFSNFYNYSKELIARNSDIQFVIASGRPFQAFSIGHQLKIDFPNIHWVPDYRDEWTTRETNKPQTFLQNQIHKFEKKSEVKWLSNCSFFITVSESWRSNIYNFIYKNGVVVTNGFDGEVLHKDESISSDQNTLNLLYLGSFYSYQDFSILFESILEINSRDNLWRINLTFLGSFANENERKVLETMTELLGVDVVLKEKVPQNLVQGFLNKADVLFLTEYKNLEGCLPVKIFDYYNTNKPILLCPSDNDLMENFIEETESGYIANTKQECKTILEGLIEKKKIGQGLIGPRNTKNAYFYTRKHQTKLLAGALDQLIEK